MFMRSFKDGTTTNFREKILMIGLNDRRRLTDLLVNGVVHPYGFKPKLHTVRESFRVRKGMNLCLANWEGKAYRSKVDKFVVDIPCLETQRVNIIWGKWAIEVPIIKVDGKVLSPEKMRELAVNDGFNDLKDFCRHFNKSATYNLIHWTNLKY